MSLRHPSNEELLRWLGDNAGEGAGDAGIDRHLSTCQRCATSLEQLDTTGGLAIDTALAEALAPPADLIERLEEGVGARLSSRQILDVVTDIFAAGFETTRLLLTEETDDDD
jgi:hypothetical protein